MARQLFFAKVNDTPRMRSYRYPGLIGSIVVVIRDTSIDTMVFLAGEGHIGRVGSDYTLLHN